MEGFPRVSFVVSSLCSAISSLNPEIFHKKKISIEKSVSLWSYVQGVDGNRSLEVVGVPLNFISENFSSID